MNSHNYKNILMFPDIIFQSRVRPWNPFSLEHVSTWKYSEMIKNFKTADYYVYFPQM